MMTKIPNLSKWLLCAGMALSMSAQAQHTCGTHVEDQFALRDRMFVNRADKARLLEQYRNPSDGIIYVPIQFHFIANSDGQGRASLEGMMDNLCRINDDYESMGIQFYLAGLPTHIDNDLMYENNDRNLVGYLMYMYRNPGTVNIYIGNSINSMGGLGTTLGYYTQGYDVIYAIRSQLSYNNKTLSHELGHFFTLAHPFFGWDGQDPYDVITANNGETPVDIGGVLVENVARGDSLENCQISADGFCDTKPDYDFGIFIFGCDYFTSSHYLGGGPIYDPTGAELLSSNSADETLIMSYFGDNCTNRFTPEQKDAIKLDVLARGFQFNPLPDTMPLVGAPTLVYPSAASPTNYYGTITAEWTEVPGADYYLVKVERMFNGNPIETVFERVETGTTALVTLEQNRQYRWSVRAFSKTDVCSNNTTSTPESFNSGTEPSPLSVTDLNGTINSIRISPNPVSRDMEALLQIEAKTSSEARISMTNILGEQVMSAQRLELNAGNNMLQIPVSNLAAGVYFVTVETATGRHSEKLVVNK